MLTLKMDNGAKTALDRFNLANLAVFLAERSQGLCEVCFKGNCKLTLHHIGRRTKPRKEWPEGVRDGWPHNELNGIIICSGIHGAGERHALVHTALVHNRPALWALLRVKYGERVFNGKTYEEWFGGPGPWEAYFR